MWAITFSHEQNSWLVHIGDIGWTPIPPALARGFADCGYAVLDTTPKAE